MEWGGSRSHQVVIRRRENIRGEPNAPDPGCDILWDVLWTLRFRHMPQCHFCRQLMDFGFLFTVEMHVADARVEKSGHLIENQRFSQNRNVTGQISTRERFVPSRSINPPWRIARLWEP